MVKVGEDAGWGCIADVLNVNGTFGMVLGEVGSANYRRGAKAGEGGQDFALVRGLRSNEKGAVVKEVSGRMTDTECSTQVLFQL